MQIIRVSPGADRAALSDMARHCGMRVGIQGSMQVLIADSSRMGTGTPNNQHRNASTLRPVSIPDEKKED